MTRDFDRVHAEIARAVRAGLVQPGPGFEHRLLDALHAPPSSRQRPASRLVAVASVALSVLVVAGLLWASPGFRARLQAGPRPGGAPAAQPAPTATATAGSAFFYQSVRPPEVAFGPVRAADWSGAALPALPPTTGTLGIEASPDGRYLKRGVGPGSALIVDGSGAVVATVNQNFDLWADDSRHLCNLDRSTDGFPSTIRTGVVVPGSGVTASSVPISGLPSRTGGFLASCSFRNDRALLVPVGQPGSGATASIFAIQLSTGQVVFRRDLPAGMVTVAAWSQDGRYVAASSGLLSFKGAAGAPLSTDILDVDTGTVVAHLEGGAAGFSGDDQLIVLSEGPSGTASVVEWRTGKKVWERPASWILRDGIRSVPGGPDVALTVESPGTTPDVVLVRGSGTSKVVARSAALLTLGAVGAAG